MLFLVGILYSLNMVILDNPSIFTLPMNWASL